MDAEQLIRELKAKPDNYLRLMGFGRKSPIYREWMRIMAFGKEDATIQAFRGSGKTTCVAGSLALMMVLYPNTRIAFMRKTDSDVKEVIAQVRKMLESEDTRAISLAIWGVQVVLITSTQNELSTNLTNDPRGSSQLTGMGVNGSLTGKHYDVIFTDDIVNLKDRTSRAEREHTKSVYMELQNIKNRGGRIVNTMTPWHVDDAGSLMPKPRKWDYTTMPEVMTEEDAKHVKERMTPSLWAANYELRFIPSDDVIFTSPKTGADPSLVEGGECHVDAAYHGEDFTAFTAMAVHDGVRYVYGRMWRKHVDDVMPLIMDDYRRLMLGRLYTETNADKGYSARAFKDMGARVVPYPESMNKHMKIVTHLKAAWPSIVFVEGTDKAYIDQICDYTEDAEHDDAPDSLASLCQRGRFRTGERVYHFG
jgi:hypothetical protein